MVMKKMRLESVAYQSSRTGFLVSFALFGLES